MSLKAFIQALNEADRLSNLAINDWHNGRPREVEITLDKMIQHINQARHILRMADVPRYKTWHWREFGAGLAYRTERFDEPKSAQDFDDWLCAKYGFTPPSAISSSLDTYERWPSHE